MTLYLDVNLNLLHYTPLKFYTLYTTVLFVRGNITIRMHSLNVQYCINICNGLL